ncbi:two-component system regulatory protein YycI [Paenibacillus sp. y28]|uniref:two-component system regulatory protein YycI n=1 Tax=Paenibacillus sp. y28 TaxID=3129110 RepID=UPI0030187E02
MDWSRAKTVLIVAFLLLNMMLGYELWAKKWSLSSSETDMAAVSEEVNRLMQSKGIGLETEIPKDTPRLREIVIKSSEEWKQSPKVSLPEPVKVTRAAQKWSSRDALGKYIQHLDLYQLDSVSSKTGTYVYTQMYGELPIFEVNLELYHEQGEVRAYKQSYVEIEEGTAEAKQKVISAFTAVRSLLETNIPQGSVISDVRLGYHGRFFATDQQPLLPFWRVVLKDGRMYYVNAFTGAKLADNVDGG